MVSLSDLKDFGTLVSLLLAAWVAVMGLRRWQGQIQGQKEFDLAYKLITLAYNLGDELKSVSGFFGSVAGELNPDEGYMASRQRLKKLRLEFEIGRIEAQAIWQDQKLNSALDGLWALAMMTEILVIKSVVDVDDKELIEVRDVLQGTDLNSEKYRGLVDTYIKPVSDELRKRLTFRGKLLK